MAPGLGIFESSRTKKKHGDDGKTHSHILAREVPRKNMRGSSRGIPLYRRKFNDELPIAHMMFITLKRYFIDITFIAVMPLGHVVMKNKY